MSPREEGGLPLDLMIEGPMTASFPIVPEQVRAGLRQVTAEIKTMMAMRRESRVTAASARAGAISNPPGALVPVGPGGMLPVGALGQGATGGVTLGARWSWRFKLLHVVGLMITLPLFATERLLLGSWCEWQGETVYTRANRTVLMALDYIYVE